MWLSGKHYLKLLLVRFSAINYVFEVVLRKFKLISVYPVPVKKIEDEFSASRLRIDSAGNN